MKAITTFILTIILIAGCKGKKQVPVDPDVYYTCSMHPQVVADKPGTCPVCHMELIAVSKNKASTSNELQLSNEQIQLGNIRVDTIENGTIGSQTVLTGTINFNEKNTSTISARVAGRIDKLYFRNTGDYVSKGAPIFELYSEELNSAKQEYVLLLDKKKALDNSVINYDQLLQSARTKLLLWGMTGAQISALERTHKAPLTTTFYSNAGGYITTLDISEGNYAMGGQTILRVANTSSVWAEAQVYATQLSQLNRSGKVTVQIPEWGNKQIKGTIDFINPQMNPQTRINLIRINIPNPDNRLKPGMAAYIFVSRQQQNSIILPANAVIREGPMAHVWLQTGRNHFKYQVVTTGVENNNSIEITEGLKRGDIVVTSGTYLLNSEYLLRSGGNAMGGMKM